MLSDPEEQLTAFSASPVVRAVENIAAHGNHPDSAMAGLLKEISTQSTAFQVGDLSIAVEMLVAHALTLDAVMSRLLLATPASVSTKDSLPALSLALQAQDQVRKALEVAAALTKGMTPPGPPKDLMADTQRANAEVAQKRPVSSNAGGPGVKPAQERLDAEGVDALLACIADGEPMTLIAQRLGVSFGSLQSWPEANPERLAWESAALLPVPKAPRETQRGANAHRKAK